MLLREEGRTEAKEVLGVGVMTCGLVADGLCA